MIQLISLLLLLGAVRLPPPVPIILPVPWAVKKPVAVKPLRLPVPIVATPPKQPNPTPPPVTAVATPEPPTQAPARRTVTSGRSQSFRLF